MNFKDFKAITSHAAATPEMKKAAIDKIVGKYGYEGNLDDWMSVAAVSATVGNHRAEDIAMKVVNAGGESPFKDPLKKLAESGSFGKHIAGWLDPKYA